MSLIQTNGEGRKVKKMKRRAALAIRVFLFLTTCGDATSLTHDCRASSCGSIRNITHPFRLRGDPPGCGDKRYELDCDSNNATTLHLFSGKYHVREIDYTSYRIRVSDAGVVDDATSACSFRPRYFLHTRNFTGSYFLGPGLDPLQLGRAQASIAFFNCSDPITDDPRYVPVGCGSGGHVYAVVKDSRNGFGVKDIGVGCQLKVATYANWGTHRKVSYADIHDALSRGFWLSWLHVVCEERCRKGKGCSVVDESTGEVRCDQNHCTWAYDVGANQETYNCDGTGVTSPMFTAIALYGIGVYKGLVKVFGLNKAKGYNEIEAQVGENTGRYVLPYIVIRFVFGMVVFVVLLFFRWRRRHKSKYESIEAFLQGNTLVPLRYSFKEIKHMTRGFKDKLGQGGFGSVYKGMLRSGSFVAVKMLKKSKDNGQEFISEVATIGRIHHTNVVQLIGFCVEELNHVLVYEFMSNGSLEKYLFSKQDNILTFRQIFDISLGVARGITYLHQGCDMQILHFDIKPHNILLDENFIPKISDFGLAKLYPIDKNTITLIAARGTLGYMAPELFYHNVGGVSFKADIYSFGMLLMEMANKRRNFNPQVDHSSESFFPLQIYDQLSGENEKEMKYITKEEYNTEAKKMLLVALWCIQLKPSDRPSINKVVEMLEGELENIEMPPKPSLYPHEMIQEGLQNKSNQTFSTSLITSTSYLEESTTHVY
ncbi:hypothetical protein Fmac_031996 [Flemingia macrophylla]|uniref:Protein kinase domain-containing protein n=1 Tax=Flemingia macrophylla TaxID=520843 RepID=A0ABD1L3M6_9FABA